MNYTIKELIEKEDRKNPYTDEQLAKLCNMSREEVTLLRQEQGILDSRERRRQILLPEVKEILQANEKISDRKLTAILNDRGYQISRFIARAVRDELEPKAKKDERLQMDPDRDFEQLIGYDGSMKRQISQAQAAVLYPPRGLHTLIHGPSGVGKSQLAEAMYHFAIHVGTIQKDSPLVIFNCADYADNSELLLSQLFGYVKGAFTGADHEKSGLVEKANGGILFLDEVHRLPSEGQEMLFYLIDKGMYRKLGETDNTRTARLLIIAATTEDLDSYLLTTFRRRIPMLIDLPPLSERPLLERLMIIKAFLFQEALRIQQNIILERDALRLLLNYPCPGNIGQLRSDIQVACARSFLKHITYGDEQLIIALDDLPPHVGNLALNTASRESRKLCESDLFVSCTKPREQVAHMGPNIYQFIEEKYEALLNEGCTEHEVYQTLGKELDTEMDNLFNKIKYQQVDRKNLEEVVGNRIIQSVQKSVDIARMSMQDISPNILSPLCLHVSASYERMKCGKRIMNPQLEKIKKEYPLEFATARKMCMQYHEDFMIELPEDEIAFIAMYLKTFTKKKKEESRGKIGIIVLTHGNVGIEMVEVANQLLNASFAVGLRCALDEPSSHALQRTQHAVEQLDEGRGCLILTDMGSLVTFGQIITQRTGIDTRTISRVDTVMVIEAIRRAILEETTLDELEQALNMEKEINFHGNLELEEKETVIVSICLTGKGSAVLIQSKIQKLLQEHNMTIRIMTLGVISENGIEFELDHLARSYHILAILGNFQIEYHQIPFLSTNEILNGTAQQELLSIIKNNRQPGKTVNCLQELLDEDIILCHVQDALCKNDILEKLVDLLVKKEYVSQEYLLDVYKREAMGATIMGKAAIPHGFTEHVTKPAIAILTLQDAILWEDDFETNIILMPALQEESIAYTQELFSICSDSTLIQALSACQKPQDIIRLIATYTKPSN